MALTCSLRFPELVGNGVQDMEAQNVAAMYAVRLHGNTRLSVQIRAVLELKLHISHAYTA